MQLSGAIKKAALTIQQGKLVGFPTETVYGLGANALDPIAVAKIFELKERPSFDPLIVHIASLSDLDRLVLKPDDRVFQLAENFWPGPLTMILPKCKNVPDIVTSGLPTVGVRMPNNEIALELIRTSGCPIAAPSANKFGRISPTTAAHVRKQLPGIDFILDGGKTTVGIESTIIRLTEAGFQVLRNGVITREEIEKIVPYDVSNPVEKSLAPGMMKSHYSPNKKLMVLDPDNPSKTDQSNAGLISFTGELEKGYKKIIRVSEHKDLKDYAANIFDAMHAFEDDDEVDIIFAEAVPETGVGKAIMDRLRKAAFDWRQN